VSGLLEKISGNISGPWYIIQGVSEISTLILTGNRTQKEQLFSLPFWRKTLRSGLKK
jgi:hypothetical protein